MNKSKTIKAALYLRVEPTNDTPTQLLMTEESFIRQQKECRKFCKENGIEVYEEHIYREECFANERIESRITLTKLLQSIETKHDFDIVVVAQLDRLARQTDLTLEILDRLAQEGVGFCSATEKFDSRVGGGIVIKLLGAIAQCERETLKKRKVCDCCDCSLCV